MYDGQKNRLDRATPRADTPMLDGYMVTVGMVSDTADLPIYAQALRIFNGSSATVRLMVTLMRTDDDGAAKAVPLDIPAGQVIAEPSAVRRIWSTGSTGLAAALTAGTVVIIAKTM